MTDTKKYIGFADFEFTCGSPKYRFRSEMLSVGVIICDSSYNIAEKFYATSKPNRYPKLSKQCRELTHLSQEEISSSPDSNDVLRTVSELMERYGVGELWVWGNFDKQGLQSDIKMHRRYEKECGSICGICNAVRDIQDEMVNLMKLPQAINIKELASSLGYAPDSGSFHNAMNDTMALYTIHKAVFTTDFRSRPEYAALVEERLEKIRQAKALQEEKRREKAFSVALSAEEQEFFNNLDEKRKSRFIYLRYRLVLAMEKSPQTEAFAYIMFANSRKAKILPAVKIGRRQAEEAVEFRTFEKKDFGKFLMDMV